MVRFNGTFVVWHDSNFHLLLWFQFACDDYLKFDNRAQYAFINDYVDVI